MTTAVTATDAGPISRRGGQRRTGFLAVPEVWWAGAATALFLAGVAAQFTGAPEWLWWALYLVCYVTGGWEPAWAGLQALRRRTLDVDLLMVVAAIGAASIGQIFDGALLIVIFATSGALEAVATRRTEDSVRGLLDLAPAQATLLTHDDGERQVNAADLAIGDELLIRPGERIGADGEIVHGTSDVDQATITGEPLPVAKLPGDQVYAGTLNGTGALRIRVTSEPSRTVIARIVAMVAEASATKAKTQLFIEKVEQRYSVGVVAATLTLFSGPLLFGAALEPTLLRAMTFMIVASPCAVVLATMPPLLSAISNAGRHGVLIKSAVVMERLGDTTVVAFDKTGTLTEGRPVLTDAHALPGSNMDERSVLQLAASAERSSEHPLGRAIVAAAQHRGIELPPAEQFGSLPGRGVHAVVAGRQVQVGNPTRAEACEHVAELEAAGCTVVVVTVDGRPAAALGLRDRVRNDAAHAIRRLTELTGVVPVLLTGDNACAATHLGAVLGIADVRAGLMPAHKVTAVRELEAAGANVLFVGDGVNDAPALAAAHTGIAMGRAGADLALDTADAVIVRDDISTIPAVIALSRHARRVVVANLAIAATFIAVLVTWDLVGHLPLPLGVAGHEGSTIIVALNGLRLLRSKAWRI
ncbi:MULTISPECIES: heavy metal translocating P-type ATPase [unclassified Mycobacterium]|uniref:heavy metal translocating P-type ATPase n=1 Tax=unclassified Mycobacterium TaxID=2642494 RepID=UPI0029C9365D|nr:MULTISPECIES: heavy metal translocating P-type ATPase [unclassified Mycobacterium]